MEPDPKSRYTIKNFKKSSSNIWDFKKGPINYEVIKTIKRKENFRI